MEKGLPALGLDSAAIPTLERFAQMLLQRNQVMNLTAITEPEDVAALHLLDSLELIPLAGLESGAVVDVGTGAGFPGLPLAIMQPRLRVTLLDSLGKRVDFLREVREALGLTNAECVHGRAEEFAAQRREAYDWAVSRAVAALPVLWAFSGHEVQPYGGGDRPGRTGGENAGRTDCLDEGLHDPHHGGDAQSDLCGKGHRNPGEISTAVCPDKKSAAVM